jgi:hypothetical protein
VIIRERATRARIRVIATGASVCNVWLDMATFASASFSTGKGIVTLPAFANISGSNEVVSGDLCVVVVVFGGSYILMFA